MKTKLRFRRVNKRRFRFAKLESRRLSEKLYLCAAANAPLGPLQAARTRALFRCVPLSPQAEFAGR